MTTSAGACLIVRDEASRIAGCIASVAAFVDMVVVADTGSRDDTVAQAAAAGASVVRVPWRDDFAAARNEALASCPTDWVLNVDADELVTGDPAAFRAWLDASPAVALDVEIRERSGPDLRGRPTHRAVKLFRPASCRWERPVHEEVVELDGSPVRSVPIPAETLALLHDGYADPGTFAAKAVRNLRLARQEVGALPADAPPERRAAILLDLGRTELAAGEREAGVATLEAVRVLALAGAAAWIWATDFLAWDAVRHGEGDRAWALVGELADHGADELHLRPLAERLLDEG